MALSLPITSPDGDTTSPDLTSGDGSPSPAAIPAALDGGTAEQCVQCGQGPAKPRGGLAIYWCTPCWRTAHAETVAALGDDSRPRSWHPPVSDGAWARIPTWRTRTDWTAALTAALDSKAGTAVLRAERITADTVLNVAATEADAAEPITGRSVTTSHETAARRAGPSLATVRRARAVLLALDFEVVVLPGRYLTTAERQAATAHHGGQQLRFASVRALSLPRAWAHISRRSAAKKKRHHRRDRPGYRRAVATASPATSTAQPATPGAVDHEHLVRRTYVPLSPSNALLTNTRTARGHNQPKTSTTARPLGLQLAAAQLLKRLPWLLSPGQHIGQLCNALESAGVTAEWTAADLLAALDAEHRSAYRSTLPAGMQRNPLAVLVTQLRRALSGQEAPAIRRQAQAAEHQERARVATERFAAQQARDEALRAQNRARRAADPRPFRQRWAKHSPVTTPE